MGTGAIVILVVAIVGWLGLQRVRRGRAGAAAMRELREKLFSARPEELGLAPCEELPHVWGVVVETWFPMATATIFSLADGTTSLYTSSGGGVIGGGQHESVRQAGGALLATGEQALALATPTTEHPAPKMGMVRFYLLTYGGTLAAEASQGSLLGAGHPLHPLFLAGEGVTTQLRLASQRMQRQG